MYRVPRPSFDQNALSELFVSELTPVQHRYIAMHYAEGLSMREISRRCGVNISTVSRTISRGVKKLRAAYSKAQYLASRQRSPDGDEQN